MKLESIEKGLIVSALESWKRDMMSRRDGTEGESLLFDTIDALSSRMMDSLATKTSPSHEQRKSYAEGALEGGEKMQEILSDLSSMMPLSHFPSAMDKLKAWVKEFAPVSKTRTEKP